MLEPVKEHPVDAAPAPEFLAPSPPANPSEAAISTP